MKKIHYVIDNGEQHPASELTHKDIADCIQSALLKKYPEATVTISFCPEKRDRDTMTSGWDESQREEIEHLASSIGFEILFNGEKVLRDKK